MREKNRGSMKDRLRKRLSERTVGGGWTVNIPEGVQKFKPKKGTMHLDILPYEVSIPNHPEVPKGELWMRRTFYTHVNVGAGEDSAGGKVRICLFKTFNKKCPICEYRAELMDKGGSKNVIDSLKPRVRELYNVIDLNDEDKGVQVWDVSYHLFTKQLEKELREGKEDWACFSDLVGGYTIKVRFDTRGIGKGEPFVEADRIDFENREDYDEKILKKTHDLDSLLIELSYEELEREFLGMEEEEKPSEDEKEEEEEEEKPTKKVVEKKEEPRRSIKEEPRRSIKEEPTKKVAEKKLIEEVEEKPRSRRSRSEEREKSKLCPAGGEFGKDCDKLDECENCPETIWSACGKEFDMQQK